MKEIEIKYKLPDLKQLERYNIDDKRNKNETYLTKRIQGIYALFINETLVYIGKSINVLQRIKQHKYDKYRGTSFTDFVYAKFEHATRGELELYETIYIDYYKPSWNQQKVFRWKMMPLLLVHIFMTYHL